MSFKNSGNPELSALAVLDSAKAQLKIKTAIINARGNLTKAASKLNISTRTLHRYLDKFPGLREVYKSERVKALEAS
jgi:DNA-binding NtrC family response regulator